MLLSLSGSNKGEELTLTLDVADLLQVSKVSNDNLYSDSDSWKTLSVEFLNPVNNQKTLVPFKTYEDEMSLSKAFTVSTYYVGLALQFNRIIVYDKGNGHIIVGRSDLPNPSLFDFNLTEV